MRASWAIAGWVVWVGCAAAADKPAALVNGEPIPLAEVEAAAALRPAELFPVSTAQQRTMRRDILEILISEKLMRQFLAKNAEPVNETDLAQQMAALIESLKAQGKTLAEFCKESQQTESQIRAGIANMIQYSSYARKRATDEELKKYFEANRDYFEKTTVRLSHVVIRIPVGTSADDRTQARKRLEEIRTQIVAGKVTFAEAARLHSQCPSAAKGGDIGPVTRKWMLDETVAQAAFAMKKGDISQVVASEFGLHLLHVTDRQQGTRAEFAAVADDVRDSYIEEMRQKLMLDLRKSAKVEIMLP